MPHYTAFVTLLVALFYFFIATRVPVARRKFNVQLPAITGHPDFERVFRVHQNTLEWLPTFLIPLWLFAFYVSDSVAAALGLAWIAGRYLYYRGYAQKVEGRLPGFAMQALVCGVLMIGALGGMIMRFIHGG